jgi:CSLREA domain-containing protein
MLRRAGILAGLLVLFGSLVVVLGGASPTRASATITVTTTQDVLDGNDGLCSLREAVIAANTDTASGPASGECPAGNGADTINVPTGVFTLAITGGNEDASATGDLDILHSVNLVGSGETQTVLDANGIDRVLDVRGTNAPVVSISRLTIRNGLASPVGPVGYGGGIQSASQVSIDRVHLLNNNAAVVGGAIYATARPISVTNSLLADNFADYGGGGIYSSVGLLVERSLFLRNSAGSQGGSWGGGLWAYGQAVIINTTFSENSGNASAVRSSGNVYLLSSTLAAGQSVVAPPPQDRVYLRNSIVAGFCSGAAATIISQGYNWINNCFPTGDLTGNITDTVQLDPLQDNGGPTWTHALLPGSPAIDAGNPAGCTDFVGNPLTTDQRGFVRPHNGRCDIGAFEFGASAPPALLRLFLPLIQR